MEILDEYLEYLNEYKEIFKKQIPKLVGALGVSLYVYFREKNRRLDYEYVKCKKECKEKKETFSEVMLNTCVRKCVSEYKDRKRKLAEEIKTVKDKQKSK